MTDSKILEPNISTAMMDHIPVGILEIDPSGIIIYVNKAGKSWARSNKLSEIVGLQYLILICDKDKESVSKLFNRACQGKTVRARFSTIGNQSIRALFAPVVNESGEIVLINCILRDVTAQILFRTKIREERSRFKVAERLAQLGYCEFDLTKRTGWASDLYYEIFGLDKTNRVITIDRWIDVLYPDDQQATREQVRNFLNGDKNELNLTYRILQKDGSVRTIDTIVIIIRDSDNKPNRIITIVKDDTERTHAIETLRQNERVLRKAQQMAKIGSWKCDLQSSKLEWSEETYRMFNLPLGTPVFIPDFERLIHEEDRSYVDNAWQAGLRGMPYDLTYRVVVNDEVKWIREQAEFEKDKSGNAIHGFGTVQDITDMRALHNANQVFNQSQAMSGIGSWRYNLKKKELYWSDSIYNLFCISRQNSRVYYDDYINAVYFEDRYKIKEASDITQQTKEPYELSYRIEVSPGHFRWILEKGDVLLDDHGDIIEMYGIVRDITDEHNTMVELIKARHRAEESDAIKDEFLSVVSHEVRTPLNSVIGLSNLLLRRNPKPEQMEILKTLKGSADNLLHLVNDILDFNKIKAGKLELESIPFRIDAFLQQLHASFKIFAQDKALDFIIQLDPRVPNQLIGDITRLNQIFNNLINNAIKFTHSGFVKLSVDLKSIENTTCTLLFEVEDSGVGIAYDKQSLIFNPFQQSELNITRQYGGTGLGLSIVKRLVEIMKGNIYLKSHLGQGTTFTLEFTFDYVQKSKEQLPIIAVPVDTPTHISNNERLSVLYVEDVMSNRFLIENLLADNQIKCTSVASGKDALKLTLTEKFDVILMDLQMPEMDGYQVTARIRRQREGKNITTPIIAFTAKPYSEALRTEVLEHEIQDLLNKPFEIDMLLEKIGRVVNSGNTIEKAPVLSFDYYAHIFEKDLSKLNAVKATIIKECKQFERKLYQYARAHDLKGVREEVHKIRPIMKNLNYTELYNILNNYEWPARYSVKLNEWVTEVRKLMRKGIKELEHLE